MISISQNMESLFRRNPRKITNDKLVRFAAVPLFKAFHIYANRHHVHLAFRNPKVAAHPLCIEIANRKETVNKIDIRTNQFKSLRSIRLTKAVNKQVLSLQRAVDRQI